MWSSGYNPVPSLPGYRFNSLIRELRSHIPHSTAKTAPKPKPKHRPKDLTLVFPEIWAGA